MNRYPFLAVALCATIVVAGVAYAQRASGQRGTADGQQASREADDTLEGVLRIHPKFHYRYYIDGFGDGQECALFRADDQLREIEPGSLIRVRGELASRLFGVPHDKMPALVSTWIIYMNVDDVDVMRRNGGPGARSARP